MTTETTISSRSPWSLARFSIWVIIPLVIGIAVSFLIPRPAIGVIYLSDAFYYYTAHDMIQQISTAKNAPDIKAVILVMTSPGGTVTDTESVYREIISLRKTKPVVTVIEGMAASGGYYVASGTDYIFAKASSEIGNIGVIGTLPQEPVVYEDVYSTGPYKIWGMPRDSFSRELEMLKTGFLEVVKLGRGDRLTLPDEVILRGQVYSGSDALKYGLIDALGSLSDAEEKAAKLAGIRHYRVVDLYDLAGLTANIMEPVGFFRTDPDGNKTEYPAQPGSYMLYIPGLGDAQ